MRQSCPTCFFRVRSRRRRHYCKNEIVHWHKERKKERKKERERKNERKKERKKEWMKERKNERKKERKKERETLVGWEIKSQQRPEWNNNKDFK